VHKEQQAADNYLKGTTGNTALGGKMILSNEALPVAIASTDARGASPHVSSFWSDMGTGLQSCDLTGVDGGQTNGAGRCGQTGAADGNMLSTIGTGNDEFYNGSNGELYGAFYTVKYAVKPNATIGSVWVAGRGRSSYNGPIYSQVLGNFDVFIGTRPWTKEDVMDGSAFGADGAVQQTKCNGNTKPTALAAPNTASKYDDAWTSNLLCSEELPGPWVTVVLRPMAEANLASGFPFVAAQQPKDTRNGLLTGGGTDSDNPTVIDSPTSPRFLVLSEIAVCEA